MAVDWRLGLVDSGRNAMDMMTAFETGRKSAMEQNAIRQRDAARRQASSQLTTGDTQAAQQTAIAAGDFDFAEAVGSYSDDQRKALDDEAETLGRFAMGLKSAPPEQREQAFRAMIPQLRGRMTPEQLRNAYGQLAEGGWSDQLLDGYAAQAMSVKDALAQHNPANEQYTLAPGSARYDAKGNLIVAQPFAPQFRSVSPGETLIEVNPTQPGGGDPASTGAGGPLSVDSVLPHIVAQESGGNYAARNRSTGALGAYQVMPATAQTLAGRLGLPWRPDLMASDSQEGRAYQDAVGRAAVKEAVDASGGDPGTMAAYYHGGSDRSKWGPKTRQYAAEVTARLSGGGGGGVRTVATGGPKPQTRTLTPQEATQMGLPAGNVYQMKPDGTINTISGTGNAGSSRKAEADLRKEFNQQAEVKEFKDTRSAFYKVRGAAIKQNPTAQDDISLIFSYMKMLDPGSVVREGEFATAQNAASVPDAVRNMYNKAQTGQRLNPGQRRNMLLASEDIYRQVRSRYNEKAKEYRGYAGDYEVNPDRIAKEYNDAPRRPAPQRGKPAGRQVTATIRRIG